MTASTPYESTGRTRQKARTRDALVAATRELLTGGVTPTVEQAADLAGVSRTTAYRYFPNQRALLAATYPELAAPSLLEPGAPEDPLARLDAVLDRFLADIVDHEPELRTHLRLSLEPRPGQVLPLRQGRAIGWFEDALEPLRATLGADEVRRLAIAIRATAGIEALVWLTDIAGLSREEAVALMRRSARDLVRAAS
jgi:AcrR family transcriptional regulator